MKSVKTFNPKSWPRAVPKIEYTVPGGTVPAVPAVLTLTEELTLTTRPTLLRSYTVGIVDGKIETTMRTLDVRMNTD